MAAKTYKARVLVLRKTRLGEKDLVVTMIDEEGMLVRGVAKGARKPGGSFAARLELFSEADVLMARGRSLDVVCEARLVQRGSERAFGLEQSSCASPIAELLCNISQPDLAQPRVFAISKAAFDRIASLDGSPRPMLAIASAGVWKVLAQAGFRPSFSSCALCARPLADDGAAGRVALAISDGGIVCDRCRRPADAVSVDADAIRWCEALIRSTYDRVLSLDIGERASLSTLEIARMWARAHTGRDLKSLDFLFASGLFA